MKIFNIFFDWEWSLRNCSSRNAVGVIYNAMCLETVADKID